MSWIIGLIQRGKYLDAAVAAVAFSVACGFGSSFVPLATGPPHQGTEPEFRTQLLDGATMNGAVGVFHQFLNVTNPMR